MRPTNRIKAARIIRNEEILAPIRHADENYAYAKCLIIVEDIIREVRGV